ncbi:MAG: hypothetical protein IJY31_06170 [Muribaculaceae bacterium]|nr:hypothetical protein [Muribaculaceae bacterium]
MKKTMSIIVIFVVFLISVSAHTGKIIDASEGYTAPAFTIDNGDIAVSLAGMKGKYVLLTLWASSDASSRIACNEYTAYARSIENEGKQFCHLSVNFDRSEKLFRELVKKDGLDAKTQFYAQDEAVLMFKQNYHLEEGFQSFLIDPHGKVIAKNPSAESLTQILSH